jgi:WXG100 family type VII secretion target
MPIRADVRELESIARKVRSGSEKLTRMNGQVNGKVNTMIWAGHAFQYFSKEFRETHLKISRTAEQMEAFARSLENIAEAFRQADLEEDRRIERERIREREASAQREREREAAVRSQNSRK